jgi:hypothetical protein
VSASMIAAAATPPCALEVVEVEVEVVVMGR